MVEHLAEAERTQESHNPFGKADRLKHAWANVVESVNSFLRTEVKMQAMSHLQRRDLLSIVATGVLADVNELLLGRTGDISIQPPGSDGHGGLIGSWMLSWPALREARSRITGKALSPVTISAVWPAGFVHPHLVAGGAVNPRAESLAAWPMQIASPEEAAQQEPLLWALATAEVHDRIYQSTWRVISDRD